jgi:hypothetical protein
VSLVVTDLAGAPARWQVRLEALLVRERGRYALWLPVFMIAGVLAYFNLLTEPPWWEGLGCAGLALSGVSFSRGRTLLRGCLLMPACSLDRLPRGRVGNVGGRTPSRFADACRDIHRPRASDRGLAGGPPGYS